MSNKITVRCPGCSKSYTVSAEQIGKKATCKSCSERFVLQTVASAPASDVPAPSRVPEATADKPEQQQPKGFLAKLKQAGKEAASRFREERDRQKQKQAEAASGAEKKEGLTLKEKIAQHRGDHLRATDAEAPPPHLWNLAKFCGCSLKSDFGLDPNTQVFCYFAESCLILRKLDGFRLPKLESTTEVLRIPLLDIEEMHIETADRMGLGRIGTGYLLAGPFGAVIGGLWKTKDKFLRIDWGGQHSIVFGKSKIKADALKQKIVEAIRQVKESGDDVSDAAMNDSQSGSEGDGTDVADAIRKLAELKDQGLLSDEEFSAKKSELLARM